jgi:hypothetical protein
MRVSYINGQISFVEETEYQSYNDYKVGDKVYSLYEHLGYEFIITSLRTYTENDKDFFDISIEETGNSKNAMSFEYEDFKRCFITKKHMRKNKLNKIDGNV